MTRLLSIALRFTAECIVDAFAIGLFIAAALVWADIVAVPL